MSSDMRPATASADPDSASPARDSDAGDSPDKNELLDGLKRILAEQNHLFACGGDVPIRGAQACRLKLVFALSYRRLPSERRESDPITIRWIWMEPRMAVLVFSAKLSRSPPGPRSRGRAGPTRPAFSASHLRPRWPRHIRRELPQGPSRWIQPHSAPSFDPYSAGIIDAVAQVLLPSVSDSTTYRGVRAELVPSLNVSSDLHCHSAISQCFCTRRTCS